jgi:transposase InsO family protein
MRYQFIRDHEEEFRVQRMCRALQVSASGYYDWRDRPCSRRTLENLELLKRIRNIHAESDENYGAIKTWKALRRQGTWCGHNRVARIRCLYGIEAKRMRRIRRIRAGRKTQVLAPERLNRQFIVPKADRVWVGDATFIPTQEGWLYLAIIQDLYSRLIVGWSMNRYLNASLVTEALMMAINRRRPKPGLIHHTDQGAVYGTLSYRAILKHHGMIASMSRRAHCCDNAVAESFFSNLKNELTWHRNFKSRDEAKAAIFHYIEIFYNRRRLHETLDYVSPVEFDRSKLISN